MSQQQDNSGVLFRNTKKIDEKKSPDYSGNVTINGQDFWISAWVKESKSQKTKNADGQLVPAKYFALAFKRRDAK